MATLQLTFSDVYKKVSEFLGLGSSPTGEDLTKVKDIVYRGYRQFLFPIHPVTGRGYIWSFRRKVGTLVTEAGKWVYELPEDFSYFETKLTLIQDGNYPNPEYTSVSRIYEKRTADNTTSYPQYYGVRTGDYHPQTGQVYEIVFWPTPNAAYNYTYNYVFVPEKPANDDDVFIGGPEASECILEMALAVAEVQEDDTVGIHNQQAQALLAKLIRSDEKLAPSSVGMNTDPSITDSWPGIQRPEYRIHDISY